jgi:hypothetical protein
MSEVTTDFPPTMKHTKPIVPSAIVYGGNHPISVILDAAGAVVKAKDRYINGSDPLVKTADELTNRKIDTSGELTQVQEKYMRARQALFNDETISSDSIKNVLDLRTAELNDAILHAPLKGATDRNGNTLSNLLQMTEMAQEQLTKTESHGGKEMLEKVTSDIAEEQRTENEYIIKNSSRAGVIHDRQGKMIGFSTSADMSKEAVDIMNDYFAKGKDRVNKFIKSL